MTQPELCRYAMEAMKNAYAPYSGYTVGAALLTAGGTVYLGCNIENASHTPTVCAERTALFKAISEGERDFVSIAVAGGRGGVIKGAFPPCGVCRQVMAEFCNPNFTVLIVTGEHTFESYTLEQLLPHGFSKDHIRR